MTMADGKSYVSFIKAKYPKYTSGLISFVILSRGKEKESEWKALKDCFSLNICTLFSSRTLRMDDFYHIQTKPPH
jgi:hypothetical protein